MENKEIIDKATKEVMDKLKEMKILGSNEHDVEMVKVSVEGLNQRTAIEKSIEQMRLENVQYLEEKQMKIDARVRLAKIVGDVVTFTVLIAGVVVTVVMTGTMNKEIQLEKIRQNYEA